MSQAKPFNQMSNKEILAIEPDTLSEENRAR